MWEFSKIPGRVCVMSWSLGMETLPNTIIRIEMLPTWGFHRYGDCYQYIRQANIFLQKAHPIMTTGTQGDQLLEDELTQMKANVRFMRAFYHYLLFPNNTVRSSW